jgi:hypothetical protein
MRIANGKAFSSRMGLPCRQFVRRFSRIVARAKDGEPEMGTPEIRLTTRCRLLLLLPPIAPSEIEVRSLLLSPGPVFY